MSCTRLSRLYCSATMRDALRQLAHQETPTRSALLLLLPDLVPMHHSTLANVARHNDDRALRALMTRGIDLAETLIRRHHAGRTVNRREWLKWAEELRRAAVLVWAERHPGRHPINNSPLARKVGAS